MSTMKLSALLVVALLLSSLTAWAQNQTPSLYRMTLRAMSYQTNGTSQFVGTPITEKDLLLAAAQAGGSSDISSLALVYHVNGDTGPGRGDTIEVWDINTRGQLATLFGLFFGDAANLGRIAATNDVYTEVRRVDHIYMFDTTTYTTPNTVGDSMGGCFTTKRFLGDRSGNVHTTVDGQIHWTVYPQSGTGAKVITGTFTTTKPF